MARYLLLYICVFISLVVLNPVYCVSEDSKPAEVKASAELVMVKGDVWMRSSSADEWTIAENSMKLSAGTSVKTGADSSVIVKYPLGTKVKVSSLTLYKIIDSKENGVGAHVDKGRIFVIERFAGIDIDSGSKMAGIDIDSGNKMASAFYVRTPQAVCAVRGTFFSVDSSDQGTVVDVLEGLVEVKNIENLESAGVLVEPHMRTRVEPGTQPTEPVKIPEDDERELQENFTDREFDLSSYNIDPVIERDEGRLLRVVATVTSDSGASVSGIPVELVIEGDAMFESNGQKTVVAETDENGVASSKISFTGKFFVDAKIFVNE